MAYDFLYEVRDGVATVTFNRPEALNALTFDVYAQLRQLFDDLRYDDAVKVVILTGAGDAFVLVAMCGRSSASCSIAI